MIACCRCFLESLVVRRTSPFAEFTVVFVFDPGALSSEPQASAPCLRIRFDLEKFSIQIRKAPRHRNPDSVLVPVNGGLASSSAALLKQSHHRIGTVLVPAFWDWSAVSLPSAPRAPLGSSVSHRYSTESGSCSFV